ncbi:MAG TPA: adenylate/guanylate cyclase domain-containing protein [Candidatus Hydrogenedentes bacterium]|nr:adenylate/guanylate cyclase domain-containing protein [Candidatus Hydrogenedentota bacterium]HOS01591.1 adenylate/guanylate cyclase domain-containing protein [Candidatus Hydrogenedentota bacterium]
MPQLIIEQPGVPPRTVAMSENEVRLGRAEDNTVPLVADEVSRHHARIVRRDSGFVILDLNSLNGTYVNRQRIVERVLSHLDEIWLGSKCRMVYRDDTDFTKLGGPPPGDSSLREDISRIREEMSRVDSNLTLIGKRGRTPVEQATLLLPEATAEDVVKMGLAYRRLSALYQASKEIASEFDLQKRLASVLDTAISVVDADRGFVLLRDEASGALMVSVAREMGKDLDASSPSMGIAGQAAFDGQPILMNVGQGTANGDLATRASVIQQRISSAMCVPLRVEDRVLGAVYLDSRRAGHEFTHEDLELFESLAAQSAMAIENVQLYARMVEAEKKRANLGRFLSPAIVDEIMKQDKVLELGGQKRVVTTMFCDIRGFTPIAERLSPAELVALLNEYFTAMTAIIFEHQGTLDKYIGDEIMAVFGAPLSGVDDPARAVRAALKMQKVNAQLNAQRAASGAPLFEIGIGICTGEVIAGYVGSPDRLEFTVVGDRVNTARRLCSLAEPGQVVVAYPTYEHIRDIVNARPIGTVMLKGKESPEHAYEVLSMKD